MLAVPYQFAVALFRMDGTCIGTVRAARDWSLAYEWTCFHHQRRGDLPLGGNGAASLLPLWDRTLGEPYCRGYRVEIARPGQGPVTADFPITQFGEIAKAAASAYVESQALREGERYSYLLVAQPAPEPPTEPGKLQVISVTPPVPVHPASLAALRSRAQPSGVQDEDDMPVFVSREVLRGAEEQTAAVRGTETGGILIGLLGRDPASGEIFAHVTAQIPAEHTTGTQVKLTFTAPTWAAAEAALRLRREDEIYLGYWHSHPVFEWCKARECTLEKQQSCALAKDFFSPDDEAVMRAAFPRAYSLALVANDTAFAPLTFSMFGNREGLLQPRGFWILED